MPEPITITNLSITGRARASESHIEPVFATYNADFSAAASYEFDLTVTNQLRVFGIPKTLFADNGSNPSELEVYVSSTDQFFVIPAYAAGYFTLNASAASKVRFTSTGGATDIVTLTLHNYEVAPVVWYSYGANNENVPKQVYGTMADGVTISTADSNSPVYIGAKKADGTLGGVSLDASNNLNAAVVGNVASGVVDSGNPVKIGAVALTAAPTYTNGQRGNLAMSTGGSLFTLIGSASTFASVANYSGTDNNTTSQVALLTAPRSLVFNGAGWDRLRKANATARLLSAAATTNATSVKTSAGDLFFIEGYNNKASAVFLKLYNKASAPTVGTDTPILTFRLGATSNFSIKLDTGVYFSVGIAYAITTAAADSDTGVLVAGDIVCMNLSYA